MSIYVLTWINDDLVANGDNIENYTLLELKAMMEEYNEKYNK